MKDIETEKHCENCNRPIYHGRSDRRFCNDGCRNSFNRKKAAESAIADHENLPEIFRIIKNNYAILKGFELVHDTELTYWMEDKKVLTDTGYNFKFFTSIHADNSGNIFHCCFEYGVCASEDSQGAILQYLPEQVEIT
jgi:predicted nucleic acid-binding Zn ribbon protein